mgnify:FL=1
MPMLDFRVETFLAVCRHMNFTKAARELNITQPAVSHHMHYLEQAYGTALFQHNGKRLQLTEAGEILRRTLMTMKHDEQHLQKRMQQVVSGTRDYSFGATLSVAEFMINEALGRFLRLHPDSHIQMQVADTKVLLSKLDSGELDFAVVEGDFPKAEYDFFVFGTEEYVAAGDPEKTLFKAELSSRFETEAQAETFLQSCIGATFTVAKAEEKPAQRYPAPPFTTSTLQQEAGRKLGMSVSQTMSVAQHLYEQGLITYMRTDSVNLSQQALAQCKEEITKLYGEKYSRWFNYKTKTKGAQEAHEAIRPSYIERQEIEGTPAEKKLYDLIWKRTVASQMVCAELDRTTITIDMSGSSNQFVAQGEVVRFDGFLRLYSESTDDDQAAESGEGLLPKLTAGDRVLPSQITATERFTSAPARYNEASLVKRLEELGIGRPSTYAPTITTIINRGYVVKQNRDGQKRNYAQLTLTGEKIASKTLSENYGKEKNRLSPTDIGMVVNDYLEEQFGPIIDYNFTASVEKEFDRIAEGDITWDKMIDEFYGPFHKMVDSAITTQTAKTREVRILGNDPKTGHIVKARIGRYGPMVEIEGNEGEKGRFASLKKGQLIESITLEEALELFALPRDLGQLDGEELMVGIGKYGPYVRYGKSFASLAKTDDPYTIGYDRAVEIVRAHQAAAAAANTPLKSFPEDADMLVKNGRYGPYIAYKGKNYRLPKGAKPEELTLDDCLKIVAGSKK